MPSKRCSIAGSGRSRRGKRHLARRGPGSDSPLEALECRLLFSTDVWIASSGGSWNTASNWSLDAVPTSANDVVIDQTGVQVTLSGNATVNSISITDASLSITGGILAITATSSINDNGVLVVNNATVALASGANLSNSGSITVNPLSELNVGGAYSQSASGVLNLPAGAMSSGVGSNLLTNAGMETPAGGGSYPTGWAYWGTENVNTQYAHTGAQSEEQSGSNAGIDELISVTPGVSYTASVYGMTPANDKLTGSEQGLINLLFYDASGNQISMTPTVVLTSASAAGGPIAGSVGSAGWNFYTTTMVAPANAASLKFTLQTGPYSSLSGSPGGAVFWDDAAFGPTASTQAVVNAGSISNDGAITIGASDVINVSGDFSQTSAGTLTVQLGGSPASLMFGTMNVGGTAMLDGTLAAVLVSGYSPAISDDFTLMNYSSESGSFSAAQLPSNPTYAFAYGVNPTYMGVGALPASTTTTVNVSAGGNTTTDNLVGVNLAWWDPNLMTAQTQSLVEAAGLNIFRFPGGSASDDFHFNSDFNYTDPNANSIPQFAQFEDSVGGSGVITVDYGSGSPQEAEAELAYLCGSPSDKTVIGNGIEWNDSTSSWETVNWQTVGYWASLRAATPLAQNDGLNFLRIGQAAAFTGMTYWEMGNEIYIPEEIDHHGTPANGVSTGAAHDPATYAQFCATFSAFVTADKLLPSILVGIDSGDPTGATDNNWTKDVLQDGLADGFVPGFISDHSYMEAPGTESDSFLLNDTVSDPSSILDWSTRYAAYETLLTQTLGSSKTAAIKVMATEYNSVSYNPGKQTTSLVNGLFVADSIGSLMQTGYTAGLVWDLRNGYLTDNNNSSTLYGWRELGDYGLLGGPTTNDPPDTGPYVAYPSYFAVQLASQVVQSGGTVLSATTDYSGLSTYAVLEPNGHVDLMVINKNPDAQVGDQISLAGFTPGSTAEVWQYGEAQDYAQSQSATGQSSLANFDTTISFTNGSFRYVFQAYSMTVIDLAPALPVLVSAAAAAIPNPVQGTSTQLSALGSVNGSGSGLTYTWSATGPGPVSYSGAANGTSAASKITANFTASGNYTFMVTIANSGGASTTSSVAVPVEMFAALSGSTLNIDLGSGGAVTLAPSGANITTSQNGTSLNFTGVSSIVVSDGGSGDVLDVNGTVTAPVSFVNTGTSVVNVDAGTMTLAAVPGGAIDLGTLAVASNAAVIMSAATTSQATTLNLKTLTVAATGQFNISNNIVFINYGSGSDPISTIAGYIKSGFNGGTWNGDGINSSIAAVEPVYGVGYADSADKGNPANLASGTIKIMYTLLGDANLDGIVNSTDLAFVQANFNKGANGWDQGDFNYDGMVNGIDFGELSANFNLGANITAGVTVTTTNSANDLVTSNSTAAVSSPIITVTTKARRHHLHRAG
jgi:alpha-L-arabinofuranosidase